MNSSFPPKKAAAEAVDGVPPSTTEVPRSMTESPSERRAEAGSLIIAFLAHALVAAYAASSLIDLAEFAEGIRAQVDAKLMATVDLDPVEEPEPEEEEPEPEPELEEPEQAEDPVEDAPPLDAAEPDAPPPAAAEAGKVLTAEPDPNEPLDLTGEGFISGTGTRFAGGVTAATGTSDKAVRDRRASGGGIEGSRGKNEEAKAAPVVDKSRPAGLPPGANWASCGFPPEADAEQINQAFVRVVVIVNASGKPTSVNILSDPGYGFGRIAQRCAMRWTYPVGLDKMGNPTATSTRPFMIRFTR